MNDLTILYYTSNQIKEETGEKVRQHLLGVTKGEIPIISISQKPINLGDNICVGEIGISKYNVYKQINEGLKKVKTEYVACCEDDTFYNLEHFQYRPKGNTFAYNCNMWFAEESRFWRRDLILEREGSEQLASRSGMFGFISTTRNLSKNLSKKFRKYPEFNNGTFWGEPGSYGDRVFAIRRLKMEFFESEKPLVVFRHSESLGGFRKQWKSSPENETTYLEQFGDIKDFWKYYWN